MRPVIREVAIDYVRQRVEWMRVEPIDMGGKHVRLLNKEDAESCAAFVFARLLAIGRIDPSDAAKQAAGGDPLYLNAFGVLASAELKRDIELVEPLRSHVIQALENPPKLRNQMRRRETNFFRDIAITMLVQELVKGFEIKPTSSAKGGPKNCACDIVAEVMGLTYDSVVKVWQRLGKQI